MVSNLYPNWWKRLDEVRNKSYAEGDEELKFCWYALCEDVYPQVAKNWCTKEVRANNSVMERVTASDECFAIMCIQRNMSEWIKQYDMDRERSELNNAPRYKCTKNNWTQEDIRGFYKRQREMENKRGDNHTGKDWDEGYMYHVSKTTASDSHEQSLKRKSDKSDDNLLRRVKPSNDRMDYSSIPSFEI
jgi:hypothetical protein